jgi:hypothetical protein
MRTITLAVAGVGVTLGLAACTATGTSSATPSGSPSATPSAATSGTTTGGSLAGSCVAGNWRGTGVTMAFDAAGGAKGQADGGAGFEVAISPDGRTVLDFSKMQPVNFSADVNNTQFKGQFTYGGKVTGAVQVSGASGPSGNWKPVGSTDWSNLIVSVDVSSPIQTRFDNVKVADFVNSNGGQAAGSVDATPILREAAYTCSGDTLTLSPPAGSSVGATWVLKRA